MEKSYYKVLEVSEDASLEVIAAAHRALARRYHPDQSKRDDAGARFKEVQEAFETLSDASARARYDEKLRQATADRAESGRHNTTAAQRERRGEDIFDEFMGAAGGAQSKARKSAGRTSRNKTKPASRGLFGHLKRLAGVPLGFLGLIFEFIDWLVSAAMAMGQVAWLLVQVIVALFVIFALCMMFSS